MDDNLQFDMRFSMTYDKLTCPLPLYGSKSSGEIRFLCVVGGENNAPDRLQYLLNSNDHKERPMIVLFFGVMSHSRRLELRQTIISGRLPYLA
ncbi:MAG: hypothetical protein IJQ81_03700, partial [Oscillibacter sp.]|nr:hypothetical protein [Oscillibacter sp.]